MNVKVLLALFELSKTLLLPDFYRVLMKAFPIQQAQNGPWYLSESYILLRR